MFDFTIKPDGGAEYEVTAGIRDVLVWEKVLPGRSLSSLTEAVRVQDMYELAYVASKRLGLFSGTREVFEATCELEFSETPEPDPTPPAP